MLDSLSKDVVLFGHLAVAAAWQCAILDMFLRRIKASARIAVGAARNLDAIADMNGWIYKHYSRLLYTLAGFFIKKMVSSTGKKFERCARLTKAKSF